MKDTKCVMPEMVEIARSDVESSNLKDLSNPKVLKSMNSSCKMVEVVTSPPTSPTHSSTGPPPKDTPRSNKEPAAEPSRRSLGEDDVHSSAPTPCANSVVLGKRSSRQRDSANKRRRSDWASHDSDEEDEKAAQTHSAPASAEKQDKSVVPDNRHKGPCSYELCPNPTHSSGGGFKIVTQETKAGHRSWIKWVGRVFCNACFTQYATRGTFERPGRQYGPSTTSAASNDTKAPSAAAAAETVQLCRETSKDSIRVRPVIPTVPLYRPLPCDVDVTELKEHKVDMGRPHMCVELSVEATGRNLKYQWLRDGQRILGATARTLTLRGPDQCRGNISCRLTNEFGTAPLFTPVRLPISPEQALNKYGEVPSAKCPPGPGDSPLAKERMEAKVFKLQCVCGKVTKASAAELATVPCQCGRICCGRTWPVKEDDEGMDELALEDLRTPLGLLDMDSQV